MEKIKKYTSIAIFSLLGVILITLNLSVFGSEMSIELSGIDTAIIVFGYEMIEERFGAGTSAILFIVLNILIGILLGVLLLLLLSSTVKMLVASRKSRYLSGRSIYKNNVSFYSLPKFLPPIHSAEDLLRKTVSKLKNLPGKFVWEIKRISIRHNIKKEYFTILLPVIVAFLLSIFAAFYQPFLMERISVLPGKEKPPYDSNQTIEISAETKSTVNDMDQIIVIAILMAITPYSIDVYLAQKRRKRYEEEFAGFLYELSELLRGGLDPISAIREVASPTVESGRSLRAMGPHLKKAAALLDWGRPFETVITRLAESLKSPLISKYSYLIVQASRMGGANASTILKSSQDLEKTIQLQREKDGMLREYVFIIFAAQFILIGILYLLNTTLLPSIIAMLKSGAGSAFGISAAATNINFKKGFFHVIMINAFASGIIAGQLTEGKARHGLKHSVILMAISYAVSLIFLLR